MVYESTALFQITLQYIVYLYLYSQCGADMSDVKKGSRQKLVLRIM